MFFSVLYLTGFSEGFIKFFGFNIYSEAVYQEIDFNSIERTTFETLDAASFGGILSVFLIYSIHKFSNSKKSPNLHLQHFENRFSKKKIPAELWTEKVWLMLK